MTLDETIKEFTDWAKDNRKEQNYWAAERNESYDETDPLSYADCEGFERDAEERAEYHEQLAEWLTELKEWKENPFLQIRTECRKNYYCNNCAFINHCPFSNGNRVAAEYPMDWVVY